MDTKKTDTPVAQLVEQRIPNPQVAGSSPSRRGSQLQVNGSSPSGEPGSKSSRDGQEPGGLYKPTEGYWVRMLTAVIAGLLVAAIGGWLWQQLSIVSLPTPKWTLTLAQPEGTPPATGNSITFLHNNGIAFENVGSGAILPATSSDSILVGDLQLSSGRSMAEVDRVRIEGAAKDAPPAFEAVVKAKRGIPIFEPVYLQAGVAGAVVIVGAILVLWLVGVRRSTVDFLIATDAEMKKVNWSTRKHILDSTWVVVGATVILVISLFLMDLAFSKIMALIGVLKG
jgi:preprotein translocase SecE subunit